ncbi:MAG: HEPN domain-containing protein [Ignavibacteria bacterium]|nr:HEPN domain-containing protein [Ignavibacteria bacterium]
MSISKNNLYTDTICFNSQQSAEKLLKCFLNSKNITYPRTHNLKFLHHLYIKDDPDFVKINVEGLSICCGNTLSRIVLHSRYNRSEQSCGIGRQDKGFCIKKAEQK